MLRPLSVDLIFAAFFVESKVGKTGLTVTVDVWRITTSGATEIVTGGSATEVGDGVYRYTLSSSSTGTEGLYTAVFKTSTTSVDQQQLAAAYVVTDLLGNVNVTQISGDSAAADNAEAFFDGTGYAGTGNVIPTVTTVTNGVTLANDAITAAKITTDAVTEIQSGLATASSVSTLQTSVNDVPTVAEFEARTLPAANYFDPATDTVANVTTVGTVTDKAGYSLSSAGIQAIWDALTSALTTVGSIGKLIVDNLNATVSSRLASASYTAPPSTGDIADAVWDEPLAGHLSAGSTGEALDDASTGSGGATAQQVWEYSTRALTDKADFGLSSAAISAIWSAGTRTLTSFGTLATDVWSAATRTLTAFGFGVNAAQINGNAGAASKLALAADTMVTGAAVSGTLSTTQMSTNLTEATNDHYSGRVILWTSGALANQGASITAYNGTTKTLTFTAVTEAPQAGDTFIIN